MRYYLRALVLCCWLSGLLVTDLYAQQKKPDLNKPKGIELVQEAKRAYQKKDYGQAMALAQEATPMLEFGDEAHVWCMVLRMHIGIRQMADEMDITYPRKLEKAEANFLHAVTPKKAIALIDCYLEASKQQAGPMGIILTMGWNTAAYCLIHRYDPVRQPMAQVDIFRKLPELASVILPKRETDNKEKEQEREAVYELFTQIGIAPTRAMVTKAAAGNDPASWEVAYAKVAAQHGADSPEAAITLKTVSNLYQAIGDTQKATVKLRKAIAILAPLQVERTPELLACYMDLALLDLQMGKSDSVSIALRNAYPLLKSLNQRNMSMSISGRRKEQYALLNSDMRSLVAFAAQVVGQQNDPAIQELACDAMLYLNGLLLDDARSLRNRLRNQLAKNTDPYLRQVYDSWLAKRQAFLMASDTQRETIGEEIATSEARLIKASTMVQNAHTDLTWQQVQARLLPGEAAVSFIQFVASSQKNYKHYPLPLPSLDTTVLAVERLYAALIIRPGYTYPQFVKLGTEQAISALLTKGKTPAGLYGLARGPGFQNVTHGDSLYAFVWQPIDKWVKGATRVYIATEGRLSQIAFAALPLPNTTSSMPIRERYLSGRYRLHQVFSLRQIGQGIRPFRLDTNTTIGLMGGIDYQTADTSASLADQSAGLATTVATTTYLQQAIAGQHLAPLPLLMATEPEVNAIASLVPNHTTVVNRHATERRFRQFSGNAPTILHIATHGLYLPVDYKTEAINEGMVVSDDALTRMGLAMAGVNQLWDLHKPAMANDDGFLTAYEVADLDLRKTRLAVLSACETGLGGSSLVGNEGVLGLQRGLRLAGVEKMILSLWDVDDVRTQQFMTFFYTYLKNGKEVRDAFQQAQTDMQSQVADPTIWAAFVLIE